MRTLKYFWLKRINLLLGLMLLIPLPTMTLVWLNGGLALHTDSQLINKWSNPGFLSAPIAMSIIGFIVGVIVLAFVLTKADIDEVLPLNNMGERKSSKG